MSGIRSYDLSGDQVESLMSALCGNEEAKNEWIERLDDWLNYRNRQMEIYERARQWFREHALKTGAHLGHHDWGTEEEQLVDWVYYQMEYANGLCWDKDSKKVIVNKYASSRPMLSEENLEKMLEFITQKIMKY